MTLTTKKTSMSLVAALALLSAAASGASLITNGSFETPTVSVGSFTNFNTGSTAITGWTVVGPQVSIVSDAYVSLGDHFPAQNGIQWLDLTGDLANSHADGVEQAVSTVPGTAYTLSYFVGNIVDSTAYGTTSTVNVLVDGNPLTSSTNSSGGSTQTWEQFQASFTAASSSTLIAFLNGDSATDNTNGLDNVMLTAGGSTAGSVPEPSAILLLVTGALACGVLLAFRKKLLNTQRQ